MKRPAPSSLQTHTGLVSFFVSLFATLFLLLVFGLCFLLWSLLFLDGSVFASRVCVCRAVIDCGDGGRGGEGKEGVRGKDVGLWLVGVGWGGGENRGESRD